MDIFDISKLSLKDMLLVEAIADTGSVSQAAELTRMTQPAASYHLGKLREVFKDPIFVNIDRRLQPTKFGHRMINLFRMQIHSVGSLIEPETFDAKQTNRKFSILTFGSFTPTFMMAVPNAFFKKTKHAKLFFEPAKNETSINQQLSQSADFFSWTFQPEGAAGIRRLVSPELKVMIHYDPAQRDAPKTIEELIDCRSVMLGSKIPRHGIVDTILIERGHKARIPSCIAPTVESIARLLEGTDLIYCGSSLFPTNGLQKLASAELPFETIGLRHELRWSISKEDDPGHRWLRNLITQISEEFAEPSKRKYPQESFKVLSEYETLN